MVLESRIIVVTLFLNFLNFFQWDSISVLLAFLKARLRFRMLRFRKVVNQGGSEGLTRICLLGMHSFAIKLMAVFMLSA